MQTLRFLLCPLCAALLAGLILPPPPGDRPLLRALLCAVLAAPLLWLSLVRSSDPG